MRPHMRARHYRIALHRAPMPKCRLGLVVVAVVVAVLFPMPETAAV